MNKTNTTNTGILANYVKPAKTVLKNGLTYSLCSRVHNALPIADKRRVGEEKAVTTFIDGRGTTKTVPNTIVTLAGHIGAKFLASTRSSFLRPRMQVDFAKSTVVLVEPDAVKETKAKATPVKEKIAKSA